MKSPDPDANPVAENHPASPERDYAEIHRRLAETLKLVAEANESRARQLCQLEEIGAWLQRGLVQEAARLKRLSPVAPEIPSLAAEAGAAEIPAQPDPSAPSQPSNGFLDRLQASLWPACLRPEAWRPWRQHLLARADHDPAAGLLLARLHTLAATELAGKPVSLELIRDLGRSIYEAGGEQAEALAQALTQAAGGRFEARAVRVGDRVDHKFMKPAAGGRAEVRTVLSWAVRDQAGLWQFPAEVS